MPIVSICQDCIGDVIVPNSLVGGDGTVLRAEGTSLSFPVTLSFGCHPFATHYLAR